MHEKQHKSVTIACQCGKVVLTASGSPIAAASCYCGSCQQAGQEFQNMPSATQVMDADGGTPFVLYRKDRIQCKAGEAYLEELRLKPESPTRRIIATCCTSPMFLDFTNGHWLSVYRSRLPSAAPPIEMRIMTKDRRADVVLEDDVPNYPGYSAKFMIRLMLAWFAMGFSRPDMGLGDIPQFKARQKV
jgi:hypothetical protein